MMKNLKRDVGSFFDKDSLDYLKHKYNVSNDSYMILRKYKAVEIMNAYLASGFSEDTRILDAGCGPGILLDYFDQSCVNYFGLDISTEMLMIAKSYSSQGDVNAHINFLRGDLEALPFKSDSFDIVLSFGVIEYMNNDDEFLREFYRVLKPEGYLLTAVTNKYAYNLMLDDLIELLRKNRHISKLLNMIKMSLNMGEFKQRQFTIRKHTPSTFLKDVQDHNFTLKEQVYFGFNILPYPLHYILGKRINQITNYFFNKSRVHMIKALGEGCLVLCQSRKHSHNNES